MDGFENDSLWSRKYTIARPADVAAVAGRHGNGIELTGATGDHGRILRLLGDGAHATICTGFWLRVGTSGFSDNTNEPLLRLLGDTGTTTHLNFRFASSTGGDISVYRNTTLLGSTTGVSFAATIGYFVEVKATLHDSTGSVEIRVDGTTRLSLTGQDTKNGGTAATFDAIQFGSRDSLDTTVVIDDWYVLNGAGGQYDDFLGDVTVETIRPDGNGNSSQWVGSDANSTDNYLLVDEATYSSADYVESGTLNNKDLYTYGALAAASGSVKGVMASGVMQKTASGAQSARQITRVGGTNYNGASVALITGDVVYGQVWEESPATSTDWTISEVNGAEFGVEVL
jgi:hypothetical protein